MTETYRDIVGYEGRYKVSDMGNVFSIISNKILKTVKHNQGYIIVKLQKNSKQYTNTIHRLVALTFISNPYNKKEVNHIDGVKSNNIVSNLEWCTPSENNIHSHYVLGNNNKGQKKIVQINKEGVQVNVYLSAREAYRKTNINYKSIGNVCNGWGKLAGGYKWEFVDGVKYEAIIK